MSLEQMMADDAEKAQDQSEAMPGNEVLAAVAELAERQVALEVYIDKMEANIDEAKRRWRAIAEKELPEKLKEVGLASYTMTDGRKVHVKTEVYASIPKDNTGPAYTWLTDNKLDGIIKNVVLVEFGRGENLKAIEFAELVAGLGLRPEQKQSIHPMTLKATLKEVMEKGMDVPLEAFGAYIVDRSKVELPAKPKGKK